MAATGIQVEIDPHSGFCPGVLRAVRLAEDALDQHSELFCIGDIVHNDKEQERLKKKGLISVDVGQLNEMTARTVLFRAHGEPPDSYRMIRERGHQLIDASCPVVHRLQKQIRQDWENGSCIVIYGRPDHPEVIALNANINNEALVIDGTETILPVDLPDTLLLFSQTTRSVEGFYALTDFLRQAGKKVIVRDSICRRVSQRIPRLIAFSGRFDKVIFVGGRHSANARLLFDVCSGENPATFFISSADELKSSWFERGDKVGVTGATSTPPWLLKEVAAAIGKPIPKRKKKSSNDQ
jgi:4-hydroxy-3-methylbut-2-en-1-yl diphosphate reductase